MSKKFLIDLRRGVDSHHTSRPYKGIWLGPKSISGDQVQHITASIILKRRLQVKSNNNWHTYGIKIKPFNAINYLQKRPKYLANNHEKMPQANMLTKWSEFMEMAVTSFSQHHTVKVVHAFVIECHMNKLCWSGMASLHENMRACDCAESCMLLSSKVVNYNYLHEHTSLNKYLSVTMK
jgi:hypothetical protein